MIDVASLGALVGTVTLQRGLDYARRGAVSDIEITQDPLRVSGQIAGSEWYPYLADVTVKLAGSKVVALTGICSCPVELNCKHAVALVLAALFQRKMPVPAAASWERWLAPLVSEPGAEPDVEVPLALQFELQAPDRPPTPTRGRSRATAGPVAPQLVPDRLAVRPVQPGAGGRWVRTGIGWAALAGSHHGRSSGAQLEWLQALSMLADSNDGYYYGVPAWVQLGEVGNAAFWDLLFRADELGVPLIGSDKAQRSVLLAQDTVDLVVDVARTGPDLRLQAQFLVDGEGRPAAGAGLLLGHPVRALATWSPADNDQPLRHRALRLHRFATPPPDELCGLLAAGPQRIPAAAQGRFRTGYLPALRRRVQVVSHDESFELPPPPPPELWLTVDLLPDHRTRLHWGWRYEGVDRELELWPAGGRDRDDAAEQRLLAGLPPAVPLLDQMWERGRLVGDVVLAGMATITFVRDVLPALEHWPDLHLAIQGSADYRPAENAPVIGISGQPADGRDWFDLEVTVSVDGEPVPLREVFLALAGGQDHMILPSGTYFPMDAPTFDQLRRLIEEARSLQDPEAKTLRVSRFQAGWWNELQALGVVDEQAARWHAQVSSLTDAATMVRQRKPTLLAADLRPYQQEGFDWLSFLFDAGLGGVLADDMGLGKTIQALALICRAVERPEGCPPFLVVAPTSVVGNWKSEAAHFAPRLKVAAVSETSKRAGVEIGALAADADVVVTSYALFRLEFEQYQSQEWAGLLLDEAQFVKNSQSLGFKNAKSLATPFKLAITGTPMENNLGELWALFSIAAPGLFPSPTRFADYYRKPIEKLADADKLAALRRRIRPLMLRRTKEQVAAELPAKQEQVLELVLHPRHQKVYQTHLQQERKKVLGLIGDLDKNRFTIFKSLTLLRQLSLDASLIDAKYAGVPSAKLDALMEQLDDVTAEGHRVLVFSQFTSFLGKVRERLDDAGIDYCYLDGRTRRRPEVLERFTSGTAPVFLISLKAGGFGLNLTEADYCILLDPWWNPATEAQAVDRAHRIGQTRTVMVYRLVAKDTIEEKVMALKAGKSALFASVMADDAAGSAALTADDIRSLFS